MSFPRASIKRFNDAKGCAPPVGSYDPKQEDKNSAMGFQKSERFRQSKDDGLGPGSFDVSSISCLGTPTKMASGINQSITLGSRKKKPEAGFSVENALKIKDLEKQLQKLHQECSDKNKLLTQKTEELKKLNGRLHNAHTENSTLLAKSAGVEKEIKDLQKSNDHLSKKIQMIDKQDKLQNEVSALKQQVSTKEAELRRFTKVLEAAISQIHTDLNALAGSTTPIDDADELESESDQPCLKNVKQCGKPKTGNHKQSTLDPSSLEDRLDQIRTQIKIVQESVLKHIQNSSVKLRQVQIEYLDHRSTSEEREAELERAVAEANDRLIATRESVEEKYCKAMLKHRDLENNVQHCTENLSTSIESSQALQAYKDALLDHVEGLEETILQLSDNNEEYEEKIRHLKGELFASKDNQEQGQQTVFEMKAEVATLLEKIDHLEYTEEMLNTNIRNMSDKFQGLERLHAEHQIIHSIEMEKMATHLNMTQQNMEQAQEECESLQRKNKDLIESLNAEQDNGEEICDKLFLESEKITDICHMVSEMCSNVDSVPFVSKNVTDMFKDLTEWQEVVDSITSLKFGHLAEVERLHADLQDADAKIEAIQTEQLALQDEICQSGLVQGGLEEEAKELHADRATMKVELDALRQQAEWQRVQLTNEAQEAAVEKYKCLEKLTVLTTELKAKTLQLLKADSEIQRLGIINKNVDEKLQQEISNYKSKFVDSEEKLKIKNKEVIYLESEMNQISAECKDLLSQISTLKSELAQKRQEILEVKEELTDYKTTEQVLRSVINSKSEEIKSLQDDLEISKENRDVVKNIWMEEKHELTSRLSHISSEYSNFKVQAMKDIGQMTDDNDELSHENQELRAELQEFLTDFKKMQNDVQQASEKLQEKQEEMRHLAAQRDTALQEHLSYKADIEKLNRLLKSQLEEVESENVKVTQESDDLISRCQEYQICSADIKEELDSYKLEMSKLVQSLKLRLEEGSVENERFRQENVGLVEQLQEAQTSYSMIRDELEKFRASTECCLQELNVDLTETRSSHDAEREKMVYDLTQLEQENAFLEEKHRNYQVETESLLQEADDHMNGMQTHCQERVESLEKKLEQRPPSDNVQRLQDDIQKWRTLFEELQIKVTPFMEQIDMFEMEKQILLGRSANAQSEVDKLSRDYAKLLGHQNQKQKIRHVIKLKEESNSMKMEVGKLREQCSKQKRTIQKLESKIDGYEGRKRFDPSKSFMAKENAVTHSPLKDGNRK